MKNRVIDYLQLTSAEYDERHFQMYFNWCQKQAISHNNLQDLLANAKIDKWFFGQLEKLENQFIEIVEHFPKKLNDPHFHYNGCVNEIFTLYPKALINPIKKQGEILLRITDEIYAN